jgi:outer membrane protein
MSDGETMVRDGSIASRGGLRAVTLMACAASLLAGCSKGLFDNDTSSWRVQPERLERIVSSDLTSRSTAPVVQPEDALKAALAKNDPMPVWPSRLEITLAEVRDSTVKNNLTLRTELLSPSLARRDIDIERAKFEATFFADWNRNGTNQFTTAPDGSSTTDALDVGVTLPLATGGTINAFTDVGRSDPAFNVDGSGTWSAGLGFSISQPLLRNAGIATNTASIRIAEYNGQIAGARTKLEVTRVLADADKAYWNLYAAYRELEVRKSQYELAVAQRDRAKRLVDQEQVAQIEVTRAESGVGTTLEQIILADATLRERVRELKRIMNRDDLPVESPTLLVPATVPNPVGLTLESKQLTEDAVNNRMELLEIELQLAIDETNIALARNAALPLFALEYRYEPVGRGRYLDRAVSNIGDFEEDPYTFGLRGEIPLGNEQAKNRVAKAILSRVQRLASKEDRRQSIQAEVLDALDRLHTAWQRILAARLETVLAARTYQAEQRQFDVGVRTSQDVLDASTRLSDAQSREVSALAQWQIAMVDIAFATGTLPGAAGIEWAPIDLNELERQAAGEAEAAAMHQADE